MKKFRVKHYVEKGKFEVEERFFFFLWVSSGRVYDTLEEAFEMIEMLQVKKTSIEIIDPDGVSLREEGFRIEVGDKIYWKPQDGFFVEESWIVGMIPECRLLKLSDGKNPKTGDIVCLDDIVVYTVVKGEDTKKGGEEEDGKE